MSTKARHRREGIPRISTGDYIAVQRILQSVWYGSLSSIEEMVLYLREKEDIIESNLKQSKFEIIEREQELAELAQQIAELETLKTSQQKRLQRLKKLTKDYEALEEMYQERAERMTMLKEHEEALQRDLERVNSLHPVTVERCLDMVEQLKNQIA